MPEPQNPPEPAETDHDGWHGGTPSALDFLSQTRGSPGIVVNPGVARETPCIVYELDGPKGGELVFSKGIVGALDPEQRTLYCPTTERRPLSEAQKRRLEAFHTAAATCKATVAELPAGEELQPWLSCMAKELEDRGERL